MDASCKRGRQDSALTSNGGVAGIKRAKESETQPGLGGKTKPCTKFFSIAGCPFGEGCHFMHNVPGGVTSFANLDPTPTRKPMAPVSTSPDGFPTLKMKLCNKYNTVEGCKFGDKCHFAHGEREIGKAISVTFGDRPIGIPQNLGRVFGRPEPPLASLGAAAASFGASATANISINASLAGPIIGKGGANTKSIYQETGVRLVISEHETDPNLRNIALEGTFDQIKHASALVRELITNISTAATGLVAPVGSRPNYKTKTCDNFTKGTCTYGDRCHFAHGANELRRFA